MLIVGAKGFAKEVLEICHQNSDLDNLVFYDDVNVREETKLYNKFLILTNIQEVENYFKHVDKRFTVGIGNPFLREKMVKKFTKIGGELCSTISPSTSIGNYGINIGKGSNILDGVIISNDVLIGEATIIYYSSIITHDVIIGSFNEISPNVKILGRAKVGDFCQLGAGSIILPDVNIGNNVIVGAGSVVTKDIPSNCTVVGVPAKIIKYK